ncbi:MAG: M20/M25/M40 family metallo-hydrolase [Gemmatimonadales bacterium]
MSLKSAFAIPLLASAVLAPATLSAQVAQERVDMAVVRRIRAEGLEHSQIPQLAHHLTDVIGPRLTGSPAMRRANDWTAQKFREWGLQNVTVEPWGEFGRGWERVSYSGQILTPFRQPLAAQPMAWTGSTKGTVTANVVIVHVDSAADLEQYPGKLENAIVVTQAPRAWEPEYEQRDRRFAPGDLLKPSDRARNRRRFTPEQLAAFRARRRLRGVMAEFFRKEGVVAIINPSSRQYGILSSRNGDASGRDPKNPEPLPQLVVAPEQYGEIYRNVEGGTPVKIELNVENQFYDDDLNAYNSLGEIPGSDKADEYIMVGAHLDSWHMGTGATDNGAGSIVMMEAMRILKALDLEPRRTIRIALWSGEEQGLLGSRAWLEKHPEMHDKISAYLNVDNGTGRIRGIWDQSNELAIPVFEQLLWPFRDLGVVAVRHGNTGGTDHLSFNSAGIPGFNFIQDPIEYGTRTHHTYLDTYDHLVLDDLKQAAVIVAATAYNLAMREEMVPRMQATP